MSQHAALPRQELHVLLDLHEVGCAKALRTFFMGIRTERSQRRHFPYLIIFLPLIKSFIGTHHERPFWFFVHACVHVDMVEKMTAAEA
jgi:hypothetical protein